MNIQNTVNSREGLLYAQSEESGILIQHRIEPRINLREFGIHPFQTERLNTTQLREGETCSLLTFQTEAVKEKATIEVRTKESIKNNKLTPFVQCKKQPANHILHFGSIKLGKPKNNHSSLRGTVNKQTKRVAHGHSEHQGNFSPMMRLPDNIRLVSLAHLEEFYSKQSQPLGVMPRDFNSFLIIRLIQAETEASPSSANAVFIPCSNDGSTLKAICLFPFPDIVMVDTWFTPIYTLFVHQVYGMCNIKTTPPNGIRRTTRGLTTMLTEVTVMALYKSTQTHPKFTDTYWIIRLDSNIPYGKVSLTRGERRLFHVLFKDDRLVWSGRKPIAPQSIIECSASQVQEVAHA